MGDREPNKKRLLELLRAPDTGNAHCADCEGGSSSPTSPPADPDWASYKLGIFICLNCCGVHRNFPDISRVKSVRLDFWDDSIVEGKSPKAVISIKDLNATFQTEKIRHPHGLQITYRRDGHIRNLFVYHESGKEIVDWFNALRAARLQYLKMAFPELPESELVPFLTRNYLKQGFMEKTGPKQREPFKKRWFALDCHERRLLYYKNPLPAHSSCVVAAVCRQQLTLLCYRGWLLGRSPACQPLAHTGAGGLRGPAAPAELPPGRGLSGPGRAQAVQRCLYDLPPAAQGKGGRLPPGACGHRHVPRTPISGYFPRDLPHDAPACLATSDVVRDDEEDGNHLFGA
ncbi:hypothetical protein H8959_021012 [Pygathrix nigripes]